MRFRKEKTTMESKPAAPQGTRLVFNLKRDTTVTGKYIRRAIAQRPNDVEWSYLAAGCTRDLPAKSAIEVMETTVVDGRWGGTRFDISTAGRLEGPMIYREVGYMGLRSRAPYDLINAFSSTEATTLATFERLGIVLLVALSLLIAVLGVLDGGSWYCALYVPASLAIAYWLALMLERGLSRTSWGLRFPGEACIAAKVGQGAA